MTDKVFPDGEETGFEEDGSFGDMEANKYAIADVDGDGYVVILTEGDASRYISAEEYEAWRNETLGGAQKIDVEYKPVTDSTEK